jgi:hypothetical protein
VPFWKHRKRRGDKVETRDILLNLSVLLPIFIGLLILFFDLRARRRLQQEDLDFRKRQFEEEKEEREERRKRLHEESLRLTAIAEPLADNIAKELKRDIKWASETLERAKLGAYAQSIFSERLGHFTEEKKHIADHFVPLLLRRCKTLATSKSRIYLLIDSGTTLYPFFEVFAREAVRCHENREDWFNKVVIATNNLPGVQKLMEVGRVNPNNRYSPLAVKCHLFPGEPLPIYSAVTGEETNKAVRNIRREVCKSEDAIFIALVVGNWIRLRRSKPACPVPLARGTGHLEFKQELINNADEIYVVTPLGKVFCDISRNNLNSVLGFHGPQKDPDRQPYSEVFINEKKAHFVKIVSTSRTQGRVLSELSTKVQTLLNVRSGQLEKFDSVQSNQVPHILFPFDRLPDEWFLQIETELPHAYTRSNDFMNKYFFIPI